MFAGVGERASRSGSCATADASCKLLDGIITSRTANPSLHPSACLVVSLAGGEDTGSHTSSDCLLFEVPSCRDSPIDRDVFNAAVFSATVQILCTGAELLVMLVTLSNADACVVVAPSSSAVVRVHSSVGGKRARTSVRPVVCVYRQMMSK